MGLNVYYGRQTLRKKLDVLNSQQFAQQYNETIANFNAQQSNPNDIQPIPFPDLNNLPPYNTDWQDEVYRPANQQSYQLNISGGTDKTRYYVAGGYFNQQGISRNSGFDRFNFKVNLDQQVSTRFKVGTNLNLSRSHTNGSVRSELALGNSGTVLGALSQIPTIPVRNANGTYGVNPFNQSDNPVGDLLETSNQAIVYQVLGNIYGEFDILKNLKARTSLGIDFRSQNENNLPEPQLPWHLQRRPLDPRPSPNGGQRADHLAEREYADLQPHPGRQAPPNTAGRRVDAGLQPLYLGRYHPRLCLQRRALPECGRYSGRHSGQLRRRVGTPELLWPGQLRLRR